MEGPAVVDEIIGKKHPTLIAFVLYVSKPNWQISRYILQMIYVILERSLCVPSISDVTNFALGTDIKLHQCPMNTAQ